MPKAFMLYQYNKENNMMATATFEDKPPEFLGESWCLHTMLSVGDQYINENPQYEWVDNYNDFKPWKGV